MLQRTDFRPRSHFFFFFFSYRGRCVTPGKEKKLSGELGRVRTEIWTRGRRLVTVDLVLWMSFETLEKPVDKMNDTVPADPTPV